MQEQKENLENKQPVWAGLRVIGLIIFFSLFPLVLDAFSFPYAGIMVNYQVPFWAEGILSVTLFIFIGVVVSLRKLVRPRKKFKKLEGGEGDILELEVLDRFTYIKLISGEKGLTEFRYFVKSAEGNWQLAENKESLYLQLQPGTLIRAAVKTDKACRQIVDFEIISEIKEKANPALLNHVADKVASEVKITGYREGQFLINPAQPLQKLKYYLVVNNLAMAVSGGTFSRTRLNQKYYEGLEQATTLQITVKDKYVYLGLPAGEDGPLTYNYFVVSTASTWRLGAHLKDLYPQLTPGTLLQIAVVDNCIMDMVFLEDAPNIAAKLPGMVMGKVVSDVKITGYQNGRYSIKRSKPFYTLRYYLNVNNIPVEVSETDFKNTPYYTLFSGARK